MDVQASTTKLATGESHSSSDPFPWGGYSEPLAQVPVVEAGALTMMFRYAGGTGEIDGERFEFDAGIDGSCWVIFPDRIDATGSKGRTFVVRTKDVIEAAYAAMKRGDEDAALIARADAWHRERCEADPELCSHPSHGGPS